MTELVFLVEEDGAYRNAKVDVVSLLSVLALATAILAANGPDGVAGSKIKKGGDVLVGNCEDRAACGSVTAGGASVGTILFSQESCAAVAPVASDDAQSRFVDEIHWFRFSPIGSGPVGFRLRRRRRGSCCPCRISRT